MTKSFLFGLIFMFLNPADAENDFFLINKYSEMREKPHRDSRIKSHLRLNEKVVSLGETSYTGEVWQLIQWKRKKGWILADHLDLPVKVSQIREGEWLSGTRLLNQLQFSENRVIIKKPAGSLNLGNYQVQNGRIYVRVAAGTELEEKELTCSLRRSFQTPEYDEYLLCLPGNYRIWKADSHPPRGAVRYYFGRQWLTGKGDKVKLPANTIIFRNPATDSESTDYKSCFPSEAEFAASAASMKFPVLAEDAEGWKMIELPVKNDYAIFPWRLGYLPPDPKK